MVLFTLSSLAATLSQCIFSQTSANAASINSARQASADSNGPISGWTAVGCFIDHGASRTLRAVSMLNSTTMTPAVCTQFCTGQGKGFAGVEDGKDCWCDGVIQTTGAQAASTDCNSPCKGDSTLLCGGPSRLEIFTNGAPSPAILTGVREPTDLTLWAYVGCYSDNPRILSRQIGSAATVDACVALCGRQGAISSTFFVYSGIENGDECWCDEMSANLTNVQTKRLPDIACESMACSGDQSKACGGPFSMALYQQPTLSEEGHNFGNPVCNSEPFRGIGSPFAGPGDRTFTLSAVLRAPPHTVFPINLAVVDPFKTLNSSTQVEAVILSACPTCTQPPITFALKAELYALTDPSVDLTGGFPVIISPGGTVNFRQLTDPYLEWNMGGYCALPDVLDPTNQTAALASSVTNKYPTILSPFQVTITLDASSPFSLCTNHTAGGRMDVVWNGLLDQLGMDIEFCNEVLLAVNFVDSQ